jgi:UDP-N-acetylglucosamine 2-epimerase (non-hydrolysing)
VTIKIACVVGTRPEVIKMAPVIHGLKACDWAKVLVVATGQHLTLAHQMLRFFEIAADADLGLMQRGQSLGELAARALVTLEKTYADLAPDIVVAQGDTHSTLAAALAAAFSRIPFLHVEAGLRSFNPVDPFPEEVNRVLVSRLARLHFAPTERARRNLLAEGLPADTIFVTGNTVIDALQGVAGRDIPLPLSIAADRRMILVTLHRRENFGEPLKHLCAALRHLVVAHADIEVLWPVHPNPSVAGLAHEQLGGLARIHLVEPLAYPEFVQAMKRSYFILTDSGGVQEEAPALGRPVLVVREETERPEGAEAGVAKIIGTRTQSIVAESERLLVDKGAYEAMAQAQSPYGDGRAAARIVDLIRRLGPAIAGHSP